MFRGFTRPPWEFCSTSKPYTCHVSITQWDPFLSFFRSNEAIISVGLPRTEFESKLQLAFLNRHLVGRKGWYESERIQGWKELTSIVDVWERRWSRAMFSFFFENKKRGTKLLVPCSSKIKNNVSCTYAVACFSVMVAAISKKKKQVNLVQSTLKHILVLLF